MYTVSCREVLYDFVSALSAVFKDNVHKFFKQLSIDSFVFATPSTFIEIVQIRLELDLVGFRN